jgi:hypothetical protein
MNLDKLKKNVKHYAPEIIVATTVAAGVAAAIYLKKTFDNMPSGPVVGKDDLLLVVPFTQDELNSVILDGETVDIFTSLGQFTMKKATDQIAENV